MKNKTKKITIVLITLLMVIAGTLAWLTTSDFKKGKINAGVLDSSNFMVEKVVYDNTSKQFVLADEEVNPSNYHDNVVDSTVHYSSEDLFPVQDDDEDGISKIPYNYLRITNTSPTDLYVEVSVGNFTLAKNSDPAKLIDGTKQRVELDTANDSFKLSSAKKLLANILKTKSVDPRSEVTNLLNAMELGVSYRFNIPGNSLLSDPNSYTGLDKSGIFKVVTFGKTEEANGDATNINDVEEDPHMYVRTLDDNSTVNEYVLANVDEDDTYADVYQANALLDIARSDDYKIPFIIKSGTSIVIPFKAFLNQYADNFFYDYTFYYDILVNAKNYMDGDGYDMDIENPNATVKSIIYNLDGGVNDSSNPDVYTPGKGSATIAAPTKEDYTFKGWSVNGNSQKVTDLTLDFTEFDEDITLTANWEEINYTNHELIKLIGAKLGETYSDEKTNKIMYQIVTNIFDLKKQTSFIKSVLQQVRSSDFNPSTAAATSPYVTYMSYVNADNPEETDVVRELFKIWNNAIVLGTEHPGRIEGFTAAINAAHDGDVDAAVEEIIQTIGLLTTCWNEHQLMDFTKVQANTTLKAFYDKYHTYMDNYGYCPDCWKDGTYHDGTD